MSQGVSSVQVVTSGLAIGKPTTMLHFEVRFLKYSGLSPVQRLKGHGEGGGGVVQVQNLVSNWQKVLCLHSLRTEERNMW